MRDRSRVRRALVLAACAFSLSIAVAADPQPAAPGVPADPGWPRQFVDGPVKLVLHQPQVDTWTDFAKLTARFAIALTPAKNAAPVWGVLSVEASTQVDHESRVVTLTGTRVQSITFPSAKDEAEAKAWQALAAKLVPTFPTSITLDRVLAYMDASAVKSRRTDVLLDPPPILVSTQPALLVIIDGKPAFFDIAGTNLQKVLNTNWDLFLDKKSSRYYLRDEKSWYSAKDLTEAWSPVTKLPDDFSKLPADEQYKEVTQTVAKPQAPAAISLVLVVNKPSELIILKGSPYMEPVAGTQLKWISNSEADLFWDASGRQFYFLTSGRWFRAAELKSQGWSPATTSLPEDFKKIPLNHPRAHVLAAVPGTRQADEAVVAASIPKTATIDRKTIKAQVKYVGEPKFEPITGTAVSYATNTPNDVFLLNGRYFLCLEGVWFASPTPNGPWEAADKVPDEIYSIPPSSSKHNVTYVTVYNSTPETVTYGYTSGYVGVYVGYGVAMWGTGYYYPPYYGYGYYAYPVYWPCAYYTYGASAWYNPVTGAYGRGSAVYGPYGGYRRLLQSVHRRLGRQLSRFEWLPELGPERRGAKRAGGAHRVLFR
jgi:hypothetical protein